MINAMKAFRKEATKIEGQYDGNEEQEARKETGEEAAIIMPNSVLETEQWREILRKIVKTALIVEDEIKAAQRGRKRSRDTGNDYDHDSYQEGANNQGAHQGNSFPEANANVPPQAANQSPPLQQMQFVQPV